MRLFLIDGGRRGVGQGRGNSKLRFKSIVKGLFLSDLVWIGFSQALQDSGWAGRSPSSAASGLTTMGKPQPGGMREDSE